MLESAEAVDSQPDRSPSKTDQNIAAVLPSDLAQSAEVIRNLITPESIAVSTDSEGDRSPGKTDQDLIIPDSKTDEAAT